MTDLCNERAQYLCLDFVGKQHLKRLPVIVPESDADLF